MTSKKTVNHFEVSFEQKSLKSIRFLIICNIFPKNVMHGEKKHFWELQEEFWYSNNGSLKASKSCEVESSKTVEVIKKVESSGYQLSSSMDPLDQLVNFSQPIQGPNTITIMK